MAERAVTIRIIGDASKATGAFRDVEVAAGKTETTLGSVSKIAGGFVVAQALTQLPSVMSGAAKQAVSLEQAAKKAATVFGGELGSVQEWAKTAANDMGLTNREAVTLAAGMGDLLKPLGFTAEQAAKMSTETLGLSGALAEWSNGQYDATEVSGILQDAMLGEFDALKNLGISLDASEVKQRAATLTGKEFANMTDAQKEALAAQQLIMEKSTDAQKAYANSQNDAASDQARATAQMKEAQEQISIALLPAITLLTTGFATLATILATTVVPAIIGAVQTFASFVQPIAAFVSDHLPVFLAGLAGIAAGILVTVIPALIAWVAGLVPVIAGHITMAAAVVAAYAPIIAIIAAVGLIVAGLYLAWESNLFGIRDITQQVLDFVRPYFETAIGAIRAVVEVAFPIIAQVVTTYINILKAEIEIALGIVQAVWNTVFPAIQAVVATVFPIIAEVVTSNIAILRTAIETGVAAARFAFDNVFVPIQGIVSDVFTTISGIVTTLWGPTVAAIGVGVDTVKSMFDGLVSIQGIVSDVFTTISGLVSTLWNSGAVLSIATGVGTIKGLFSGIYSTMYGYGRDIVQGLVDGIVSLYGTLEGWVRKIADLLIIDVPGFSPPYDAGYAQGQRFVRGLADGVLSGLPGLAAATGAAGDSFVLPPLGGPYLPPPPPGRRPPDFGPIVNPPPSPGEIGPPLGGPYVPPPRPMPDFSGTSPTPDVAGAPNPGTAMTANTAGGGTNKGIGQVPPADTVAAQLGYRDVGTDGSDQGMAALTGGAEFVGCAWQLAGSNNDWGLFRFPDGKMHWRSTRFCRNGRDGPSEQDLHQARHRAALREPSLRGTVKSTGPGRTTYYGSPADVAATRAASAVGPAVRQAVASGAAGVSTISDEAMERLARVIARELRSALTGAV